VERALAIVLRAESVGLTVAGRTDAGVHAWEQVASYSGPPAPVAGLNALLPSDVAVLSCVQAAPGFDARRDATSRAYCYRVLVRAGRPALEAGRILHWPGRLDCGALREGAAAVQECAAALQECAAALQECAAELQECAAAVRGRHDFTAFTPTQTEHVRFERDVFGAFWRFDGDELQFWIEADAFMRHMNRVLVGTMLEVAGGRRSVSDFVSLLEGRPRSEAGPTAPAHGLYLAGVGYGERVLGES
jgi:tRNA pseudouridine38-40 synthase